MTQEINLELQEKIADLESKLAFQDITIADLNTELAVHQEKLDRMHQQLKMLFRQLNEMKGDDVASAEEETPPPHY